jgi:hypothetical protein
MVGEVDMLAALIVSDMIPCYGGNTDVWVEITGGEGPFCYNWDYFVGGGCPGTSEPDSLIGVPVGNYQLTITDVNMCMTVAAITITQPPELTGILDTAFCEGESVTIYGVTYTMPGQYMDTIVAANGCDSIITINITQDPYTQISVDTSHCDGDSVLIFGQWYTGPITNVSDTLQGQMGQCDTIVTIDVTVDPLETLIVNESHCPGDSVLIYGEWYIGPVTGALDTVAAVSGCDTIVTINVMVEAYETLTVNETHCPGDSVQIYGVWYIGPISGLADTIPGTVGCDTIVTINVMVEAYETLTVNETHCPGDSIQIYGVWYMGPISGLADTIPGTVGCDTIVTINVMVEAYETLT